jgi:hypothetical protein
MIAGCAKTTPMTGEWIMPSVENQWSLKGGSGMWMDSFGRRYERHRKIQTLIQELDDLLVKERSTPSPDPTTQQRRIQRLLVDQLAALRLQQAEDRLLNNFAIAMFSGFSGIAGTIVGFVLHKI